MNQSTLRLHDDRIKYLDSLLDSFCFSDHKGNLQTDRLNFYVLWIPKILYVRLYKKTSENLL